LFLVSSRPVVALDPHQFLTQYIHTSWVQREEFALPSVAAIAQTAEGSLWLGTGSGLLRFDGMRFTPWTAAGGEELPANDILALQSSSDGGLWVATRAGIGYVVNRRLTNYTRKNGLPGGNVVAILAERSGGLWVATSAAGKSGLALIQNGVVKTYGAAEGIPKTALLSLFEDRDGTLWMGGTGLCRWRPGQIASCMALPAEVVSLQEDEDHSLLAVDAANKSIYRLSGGKLKLLIQTLGKASLAPKTLLKDRAGNIWLGTLGQGLLRLREGKLERFTRREGLSSDVIESIFEDREGNLWVGTASGLDRFRDPKVSRISTLEGLASDLVTAVYATRDGATWVGTEGGGLDRCWRGKVTHYQMNAGLPSTTVLSLYEDPRGRLWTGTTAGLAYLAGDRFKEVRSCGGQRLDRVFAITGDERGEIWLADAKKGLLVVRNACLEPVDLKGSEDRKDIYSLQCDRQGRLWVGYYGGGLLCMTRDGEVRRYTRTDGMAAGAVQAIYDDGRGAIWVGAAGGLSRLFKGKWTTWTTAQGLLPGGVYGIAEDNRGQLWLRASADILHVRLADLNTTDGKPGSANFLTAGIDDGVRLGVAGMANPRLTQSMDGRLWFSTEQGVAVVDPEKAERTRPLPVTIRLRVDGKPPQRESSGKIGVLGRELQFEYTALNLATQEDIRFRYKLEELDRDWRDAGSRREAVYSNLAPGSYRFRVTARTGGGVWDENDAVLPFQVERYYYQTLWFGSLCAIALGLMGWGIHWLRERQLRHQFQLVLRERTRLTRELHDTLLQGFAGVVYRLEASWRQFDNAPAASKEQLERALDQADRSLTEARQTITFLRMPMIENSNLAEILSIAGKQLTEGTPVAFEFTSKGEPRQLSYDEQWNLYALVREAMNNAIKHAQAKCIHLEMACSDDSIQLIVKDDGIGFDQAAAAEKKTSWGLRGMSERAKHIGGRLKVVSAPGSGTTVEFTLRPRKS